MLLTLDTTRYTSKPTQYVGAITNRMKASGSTEVMPEDFAEAIRRGQTWSHGAFEPSQGEWGKFVGLQVVGLDFDNDAIVYRETVNDKGERTYAPVYDADGHKLKRMLMPHEEGYLDPTDALDRCEQLDLTPLLLYFSMSSRNPDKVKYRLVIDLGELVTDEADAAAIVESLLIAFPEADQSCSNLNRLFFGTRPDGEVWECWRSWARDGS